MNSVEITDRYNQIYKHICTLKLIPQCIYSFVLKRINTCVKKNIIQPTSSNINSSRHSLIPKCTFGSPYNEYSQLNEALLYFCKKTPYDKIKSPSYSPGWLFSVLKLRSLPEVPLEDRSLFELVGLYKLSGHAKMANWVRLWVILWLQRLTAATSNSSHFRSMSHSCNITTRGALHTQTLL